MSAPKHTPGPWQIQERVGPIGQTECLLLRVVSRDDDLDVADLNCDANDDEAVEATRADAALISAAPELADAMAQTTRGLEALRASRCEPRWPGQKEAMDELDRLIDIARAALRKARRLP